MSADNVIAIGHFKDGYYVTHAFMTILQELSENQYKKYFLDKERKKILLENFKSFRDARFCKNLEEAEKYAYYLLSIYGYVEYGIARFDFRNISLSDNNENKFIESAKENKGMATANKFWLVLGDLPTKVTYKHQSEYSARSEAQRLATANPGKTFYVVETKTAYRFPATPVQVEEIFLEEPIPF